ncbi:MAG: histidinol-phosphate transaminase, partial [Pseudomonadota bacterium]
MTATALAAPRPQTGIMEIAAYVPGHAGKGVGGAAPMKLSSNENPHGPSPRAREAAVAAMGDLARYPDGASTALREAIAQTHGLEADRIVCGAGS